LSNDNVNVERTYGSWFVKCLLRKGVPDMSANLSRLISGSLLLCLFAVVVTLGSGCGGFVEALVKDEVGISAAESVLPLDSTHVAFLSKDVNFNSSEGWYTAPAVADITINTSDYPAPYGLKAEIYGDQATTGHQRYFLAGQYSALALHFGVTKDEPDSPSWTAFRFYGDGHEIATPHYVKKGERRQVIVDVRGVQYLDLIAEGIPQTDGVTYGSTKIGWGVLALLKESGARYIVDLPSSSSSGWVEPPSVGEIAINWHPYPHSLKFVLPSDGSTWSSAHYHLAGEYNEFAAVPGVSQDETDSGAVVEFDVLADSQLVASQTAKKGSEPLIRLDVTGVEDLELRAKVSSGATEDRIDAGWGMAVLLVGS
jgi:hypothetical protein